MANETGPYVRVRKMWGRPSGWSEPHWMYFVDLINHEGKTCNFTLHDYGMEECAAKRFAEKQAAFFGWPIRNFVEDRRTTVELRETQNPL